MWISNFILEKESELAAVLSLAVGVRVGYLPSALHNCLTAAANAAGVYDWERSYFTLDLTPSHLAVKAGPHREQWEVEGQSSWGC